MVKEGGRKNPKHPSRDVLRKTCSENLQQIYRSSPVNLLHIFRIRFYKNTSGGLFLDECEYISPFRVYEINLMKLGTTV